MKKFVCAFFFTLVILFTSCSNMLEVNQINEESQLLVNSDSIHTIDKYKAIEIATRVLGQSSTRSIDHADIINIECLLAKHQTRSLSVPDTLAYIINFSNDQGFVIVSSSNRVYPVLGFSNEGNFSLTNEIANANFIYNIENYIENADGESSYEVKDSDFDECYVVDPMVKISLGQRDPWNKFVIQEYPGCPVGCVAVATALVISHSCNQLSYHGVIYPINSIISAINQGAECDSDNDSDNTEESGIYNSRIVISDNSLLFPQYSYEQAVDSMAKILYWIGKDVNMSYSTTGSSAYSYNAYDLCKSLNFSIPSGYANFDIKEVTQYLKDNHIVYLRGSDINNKGGHAWVSDGCYFCVDMDDETQILDTYIHCDWGWNGSCNGYYSGSVFEAGGYNFKPANYFAVKRNSLLIAPLISID